MLSLSKILEKKIQSIIFYYKFNCLIYFRFYKQKQILKVQCNNLWLPSATREAFATKLQEEDSDTMLSWKA